MLDHPLSPYPSSTDNIIPFPTSPIQAEAPGRYMVDGHDVARHGRREQASESPIVTAMDRTIEGIRAELGATGVGLFDIISRNAGTLSYNDLADLAKLSRRHVMRLVEVMEKGGWVAIERRQDRRGGHLANLVTVSPPSDNPSDIPSDIPSDMDSSPPSDNPSDMAPHTPRIYITSNVKTNDAVNTQQDLTNDIVSNGAKRPKRITYPGEFEEFWLAYPSGHGVKKSALDEWRRLAPDDQLRGEILSGLAAWKQSRRWQDGYIRDAERFLKHRMWESPGATESPNGAAEKKLPWNSAKRLAQEGGGMHG